ncbi:MAG TPA: NADPH:quinone reductase [Terriglobia bacterium]|nr:NADPH:quinone reductase [Terriglobia bacterium]
MKAIRVREFGGPEVMRLEDVPDPVAGAGQVVVRVHAAGVNPVDAYIRGGGYAVKPALPYTPGSDAAGVAESVGADVASVKPGDRVYTAGTISGAYAELALCAAGQVHPLPERVTFGQGAGVWVPYGTAYRALFQRAQARPGESVLVHGASGGVGIAAVELARASGLTVIGTAGTEKGRKLAIEHGAHHVLDHTQPAYLEAVAGFTAGAGVNLILEMLANVNLGQDLPLLAANGRVVVIGSRGTVEINPRDAMGREASILGMTLTRATPAESAEIHAAIGAGLAAGTLRPVVGQGMPLGEAARAHVTIMSGGAYGKIVLEP